MKIARRLDDDTLKTLSRRCNAKGLVHLSLHCAALALAAVLVALSASSLWVLPAMFLLGVLLVFLFAPLHESIHRTAFRSPWLNQAVAFVCGLVLFLPARYFRAFHLAHHRDTQDPRRDPELACAKPASWREYLQHVSGMPYWRERIATTLKHVCGRVEEPFVPLSERGAVVREARVVWSCYAVVIALSAAMQSAAVAIYWLLPIVLAQPVLRLYLLAEHTGCPYVPDMIANSRTTRSNALVRTLAWNMPYHVEHHCYPALPFHALPAAHENLRDDIEVLARGYLEAHRQITAQFAGHSGHETS